MEAEGQVVGSRVPSLTSGRAKVSRGAVEGAAR